MLKSSEISSFEEMTESTISTSHSQKAIKQYLTNPECFVARTPEYARASEEDINHIYNLIMQPNQI